jgi:hypothetical protein
MLKPYALDGGHLAFWPHRSETAAPRQDRGIVLVAQDTTDFRYKGDARIALGSVSTSKDKTQGFYAHLSLVVAADGRREPLGVLATQRRGRTQPGVSTRRRAGELSIAQVRQLPREFARWGRSRRAATVAAQPKSSGRNVTRPSSAARTGNSRRSALGSVTASTAHQRSVAGPRPSRGLLPLRRPRQPARLQSASSTAARPENPATE